MEKYKKINIIGYGNQGTKVYKVLNLIDNEFYAMKKILIKNDLKNDFMNEIAILEHIRHPCIIQYYEHFFVKDKLYIIMEFATKGDLNSYIEKRIFLSEDEIIDLLRQICEALSYLHLKKILHRDIKPKNIFLTEKGVKIGDFGISKVLKHTMDFAESCIGTPYYLSPEICKGSKYNAKADIWMVGCTLYELMTHKKPFPGNSIVRVMNDIVNNQININFINRRVYSDRLITLVKSLLNKDPNQRPISSEVIEIYSNNSNNNMQVNLISSSANSSHTRLNTEDNNSKDRSSSLTIKHRRENSVIQKVKNQNSVENILSFYDSLKKDKSEVISTLKQNKSSTNLIYSQLKSTPTPASFSSSKLNKRKILKYSKSELNNLDLQNTKHITRCVSNISIKSTESKEKQLIKDKFTNYNKGKDSFNLLLKNKKNLILNKDLIADESSLAIKTPKLHLLTESNKNSPLLSIISPISLMAQSQSQKKIFVLSSDNEIKKNFKEINQNPDKDKLFHLNSNRLPKVPKHPQTTKQREISDFNSKKSTVAFSLYTNKQKKPNFTTCYRYSSEDS